MNFEGYKLRPEIFNNKTNGICHRRFLAQKYRLRKAYCLSVPAGDDANELQKLSALRTMLILGQDGRCKKEEKASCCARPEDNWC